jgi:hypothetical protein
MQKQWQCPICEMKLTTYIQPKGSPICFNKNKHSSVAIEMVSNEKEKKHGRSNRD